MLFEIDILSPVHENLRYDSSISNQSDPELMKRLQNLYRLISDIKQKNQELLDYIDKEYSNPREKHTLLNLLEFSIFSYDDAKPFESFIRNLTDGESSDLNLSYN
ncbi:hypothetical protein [Candidatus Nitrosocosmicus franklandus]|nr:hypothetical protein [Candidatus Nitrosocosmicus franklandus]